MSSGNEKLTIKKLIKHCNWKCHLEKWMFIMS